MKNIYIFGDSFADPHPYGFIGTPKHKRWPALLSQKYSNIEVNNFAKTSSGPHYSFSLLYDIVFGEQNIEDDLIIFILSGNHRIKYPDLRPEDGCHISWDFTENDVMCSNSSSDYVKEYFKDNRTSIRFVYETFMKEILYWNSKCESFLYYLSRNNKCRIFLMIKEPIDNEFFKSDLNDFYFHKLKYSLRSISENEIIDLKDSADLNKYPDIRPNHLSLDNHNIMFNKICDFIEDKPNKDIFLENLNTFENCFEIIGHDENKFNDFIYE